MTFTNLKKRAAKELNLLDSSGAILTGRDITETDLGNSINEAYYDVVHQLAAQYPFLYEVTSYAPNYVNTSTISSITATTLVTGDAIFVSGSIGCNLYNSTKEEIVLITGYTNTTTVTTENDMSSDWDATDTVYLLEREYSFAGDATDYISNLSAWIRFGTSSEYYEAEQKLYSPRNSDFATTDRPVYVLKQIIPATGTALQGFEVFPLFEEPDSKAIFTRYLQLPAQMSEDTDTPRLPAGLDEFLYWKAVEYGAVQRNDTVKIQYAQQEYQRGLSRLLSNFKPLKDYKTKRDIASHYKHIRSHTY